MPVKGSERPRRATIHRWIRLGFIVWAIFSTAWLLNSFRTQGVARAVLSSDANVRVVGSRKMLVFRPAAATGKAGLVFVVGAGVAAEAYAPLLRPIAELGHLVHVVRLPYWVAPLESHKLIAVRRVIETIEQDRSVAGWVVAGHSLGAALASRVATQLPERVRGIVLIATSHPKRFDLSRSSIPFTKVVGTNDGVATPEQVDTFRHLLPAATRWVVIEGGNHSQFGHYGHQLFDGTPTISRERQQAQTREALLDALEIASNLQEGP